MPLLKVCLFHIDDSLFSQISYQFLSHWFITNLHLGYLKYWKLKLVTNIFGSLTWDAVGLKISKCYSFYKSQRKVSKSTRRTIPQLGSAVEIRYIFLKDNSHPGTPLWWWQDFLAARTMNACDVHSYHSTTACLIRAELLLRRASLFEGD